jgi:hypothetical protein
MAELKHKLEQEGSSIAPKSSRTRGASKQPGSKDASAGGSAALPPLPTPTGSIGGAAASSGGAAAGAQQQQQQQPVLRVAAPAEEAAEGEEEDVDMLQVRSASGCGMLSLFCALELWLRFSCCLCFTGQPQPS